MIASCCAAGAASVSSDENIIKKAKLFGEKVGIAFQIKDDLFDYGTDEIGKPLGIDIKERKMTLPLIYALNNSTWLEKRKIIYIIKNQSNQAKKVAEVIDFVKNKGGMQYAIDNMNKYHNEALEILNQFPESKFRDALQGLVDFTINRKK